MAPKKEVDILFKMVLKIFPRGREKKKGKKNRGTLDGKKGKKDRDRSRKKNRMTEVTKLSKTN